MKYTKIVFICLAISWTSYGQNTSPWPATGNIGIGTTSPDFLLQVHSANVPTIAIGKGSSNTNGKASLFFNAGIGGVANGFWVNYFKTASTDRLGFVDGGAVERMSILNGGNVGVGTTTPSQKLEINGSILENSENVAFGIDAQLSARLGFIKKVGHFPVIASDNGSPIIFSQTNQTGVHTNIAGATLAERMRIDANGNVGIGTTTPSAKLNIYNSGSTTNVVIGNSQTGSGGFTSLILGTSADTNGYLFIDGVKSSGSLYGDVILNRWGGNVGIGTTAPDAKLAVKGTVHAQEVKVDLSVPGPDYVFDSDYKLLSLEEIKTYIDKNKHLPEVPSAKEMEANGVNLGEMNMLLLKKIEELTLHIIDLEKRIKTVESKN